MPLDEFGLIQRYFTRPSSQALLGVGDDCALLQPTVGMQLAVSADTLLQGRHFFADCAPHALGYKALAVNLSDMAAMGAIPRWFTLCLTLPELNEAWLADFSQGLFEAAEQAGVALVGGDTTRGPLSISIQILGEVEPGLALRRDGAHAGDDIWLSGSTGAAALAVAHRYGQIVLNVEDLSYCAQRLDYPQARLALGRALRGVASAALDISDGLLADLGHLAKASGLAAVLEQASVPSAPISIVASSTYREAQLAGGDDYELCFCAPIAQRTKIEQLALDLQLPLSRIGHMQPGQGVTLLDLLGQAVSPLRAGFNHFG